MYDKPSFRKEKQLYTNQQISIALWKENKMSIQKQTNLSPYRLLSAQPATYEIQKEDDRYFIVSAFKRLHIGYDKVKDCLSISYYGEYLRNWQVIYVNHSNQL